MKSVGISILVIMVTSACLGTAAEAGLILTMSGGGGSFVSIVDDSPAGTLSSPTGGLVSNTADSNGVAGVIGFNGTVGNFSVNVTGVSKPNIGPLRIDFSSVNVTSNAAGAFNAFLADTDFTHPTGGLHSLVSDFTGTTDGTVTLAGGWNPFNAEVNVLSNIAVGPLGPGAFTGTDSAVINITGGSAFTLGHVLVISATQAGQVSSISARTQIGVPEPASLALLLVGAGAFALRRRRR